MCLSACSYVYVSDSKLVKMIFNGGFFNNSCILNCLKGISNAIDYKHVMQISFVFILQGVCRRILCPPFRVRKGRACQSAYTNFVDQPKTAIILFHEIDKTIKSQDPYKNLKNNIAPIVDSDILTTLL